MNKYELMPKHHNQKSFYGKAVVTVLEIIYLIMRNSRWLILIIILAPVTYY